MQWVLILLVIGGAVSAILYSRAQEKKRREEMAQFVEKLGLTYYAGLSSADQTLFNSFEFAQKGHSRKPANAIEADSGDLRMLLFDYTYSTGGGKSRRTHRQTVVIASAQDLQLPEFQIFPESGFHWLAEMFGSKDIDFDEDTEFSQAYVLKGSDEVAIREYFVSSRRKAILELGKVHLEARGNHFLLTRHGARLKVDQIPSLMDEVLKVNRVMHLS